MQGSLKKGSKSLHFDVNLRFVHTYSKQALREIKNRLRYINEIDLSQFIGKKHKTQLREETWANYLIFRVVI